MSVRRPLPDTWNSISEKRWWNVRLTAGETSPAWAGAVTDGSGYHKVEPAQMAAVVGPGLHLNSGQGNGNVVCVSFMGAVVG